MASWHLLSSICLTCGTLHAQGTYLILFDAANPEGWRLGRFCSYACLAECMHDWDPDDIPDEVVAQGIMEEGADEEAYQEMMDDCPDHEDDTSEGTPEPTGVSSSWRVIHASFWVKAN